MSPGLTVHLTCWPSLVVVTVSVVVVSVVAVAGVVEGVVETLPVVTCVVVAAGGGGGGSGGGSGGGGAGGGGVSGTGSVSTEPTGTVEGRGAPSDGCRSRRRSTGSARYGQAPSRAAGARYVHGGTSPPDASSLAAAASCCAEPACSRSPTTAQAASRRRAASRPPRLPATVSREAWVPSARRDEAARRPGYERRSRRRPRRPERPRRKQESRLGHQLARTRHGAGLGAPIRPGDGRERRDVRATCSQTRDPVLELRLLDLRAAGFDVPRARMRARPRSGRHRRTAQRARPGTG